MSSYEEVPDVPREYLYEMESEAYEKKPKKKTINKFELFPKYTDTIKIFVNEKHKEIVCAVLGTADYRDMKADLSALSGSVENSKRYKEDKNFIEEIQKNYFPTSLYSWYAVGHSLGGMIIDVLLKDKLIKSAVSYNPAVEYKYRHNKNHKRVYNEDDILYAGMGRYASNVEVRPNKTSLLSKLASLTKLGRLSRNINAHLLSNFVGGKLIHQFILN